MKGWLVLPDLSEARRVVAGSRCLAVHASGRPWLVGSLNQGELTLVTVGPLRVGVIGLCPLTPERLAELVVGVRSVAQLDAVAAVLVGSWHLVACLDGVVRVQGSLTGLCRVFHTRVGGMAVAGDRADVLANVAGTGIDEQILATRVACGPAVPPPISERSWWRGVHAVAPDQYLRIDPDGKAGEQRWWRPPEPQLPLTVGSVRVGEALQTAVAARSGMVGRMSADLSGGLDSTSLCFLATRAGRRDLLTFRWAEADAANDDAIFAAHATRALPEEAEHVVLAQAQMPGIFTDPGANGESEAPYQFTRTLARTRHNAEFLATRGARHHVAGHGGDELFHHPRAYLYSLLRSQPITAIKHIRGYRALERWSWVATVAALIDKNDVSTWWHQQAHHLTEPLPRRIPDLGWGYPLRAPRWVTPAALESTRAVLRSTGDEAQPLADDRSQHTTLAVLRTMGAAYRQLSRVFTTAGLRLELPYFDDRVVEAVLAVRTQERRTPWRYKPLLVEAVRGVLPEVIAARTSKGEFGEEARVGFRRNLPKILKIFADSALAAHGVIDSDLLRRELLAPQADNTIKHALEDLLGCETWLRATQSMSSSMGRNSAAAAAP